MRNIEAIARAANAALRLSFPASLVLGMAFCPESANAVDGPQFEAPIVHPIEMSSDGSSLYALHPADHRLVVFDLTSGDLPTRRLEVFVGLEPVTVRERQPGEVWVVNHLSDSISIVDTETGSIRHTLRVGDEPTDVVFAGSPERAFVCVSEEDRLRVFDPENLELPPVEVDLPMSNPLNLAVSPDGSKVYVSAMDSGNQTTIVKHTDVADGGGPPPPDPPMNFELPPAPLTSLIVRHDGSGWKDEAGTSWDSYVPYTLLDYDVLAVDTNNFTYPQVFSDVGTTLLGLAVGPSGRLYVSNQEALNHIRFEPNLSGSFAHNRVTVIDPSLGTIEPRDLNPHIDYSNSEGNELEREQSLSFPAHLTVSEDGETVYVAAFGSSKVGVLGSDGVLERRIDVGYGPMGVALDEARDRLYVLRRIPGAVDVVDLSNDLVSSVGVGFDPVPAEIHSGRRLFYDGRNSSSHGDLSCASCHVYGGTDHTAWDLGDPQGFLDGGPGGSEFHPMKGPLVTQTLRGLPGTEPFHWRGDRQILGEFNGAFVSLMGRSESLISPEFADLESFIFSLTYPPNPNRNLDGSLPNPAVGPNPTIGGRLFEEGGLFGGIECTGCHTLPFGQNGIVIPREVFNGEQDLDVPQLRNIYEKTGFDPSADTNVRGFGFLHDGVVGDLVRFFERPRFNFQTPFDREHVDAFMMCFDTGTHAAVGAQWTTRQPGGSDIAEFVDIVETVASSNEIGLIAKGRDLAGDHRGWYFATGSWISDRADEPSLTTEELLALANDDRAMTVTAVYPGTELRLGVDRDLDGRYDRDELDDGTDPGDPNSLAPTSSIGSSLADGSGLLLEPLWPNPADGPTRIAFQMESGAQVQADVHDASGRRIRHLGTHAAEGGRHELLWDLRMDRGERAPAGVYFVRVSDGTTVKTKSVVLR